MALQTMYPGMSNSPKTMLTAGITSSATSITVADASVLPVAPNIAVIGSNAQAEVIIYSGKNGNILTGVVRGAGSTTARSWNEDTVVARNFTLLDYENICANITELYETKRENSDSISLATGVTGTLPVENGGTGKTSLADVKTWLGLAAMAFKSIVTLTSDVTGVLPVANGGTGQTTLLATRNAMGLGNTTGAVPVANGGTGLTSSPSMLTNLGSTSAANILTASPRPGVTGTLAVGNGGTGLTSSPSMLTNLGSTSAANVMATSPRPGVTGTLGVGNGGTGQTSLQATRNAMGLGNTTGALPIANGGTGSTSAANARTALGVTAIAVRPDYQISTSDLTDGSSALANGKLYFVY